MMSEMFFNTSGPTWVAPKLTSRSRNHGFNLPYDALLRDSDVVGRGVAYIWPLVLKNISLIMSPVKRWGLGPSVRANSTMIWLLLRFF